MIRLVLALLLVLPWARGWPQTFDSKEPDNAQLSDSEAVDHTELPDAPGATSMPFLSTPAYQHEFHDQKFRYSEAKRDPNPPRRASVFTGKDYCCSPSPSICSQTRLESSQRIKRIDTFC